MPNLLLANRAKPTRAASTDRTRPQLCSVYVRELEDGALELIATDSYLLAHVPLPPGHGLTPGPISVKALAQLERGREYTASAEDGAITIQDEDTRITYGRPDGPTVPTFVRDLPTFKARPKTHTIVEVGLNPKLLQRLADAIGSSEGVRLRIPVPNGGHDARGALDTIQVTHTRTGEPGPGDAHGLLMPIRLSA